MLDLITTLKGVELGSFLANHFCDDNKLDSNNNCPNCNGSGTITCPNCSGQGCSRCSGTGKVSCPNCFWRGEMKSALLQSYIGCEVIAVDRDFKIDGTFISKCHIDHIDESCVYILSTRHPTKTFRISSYEFNRRFVFVNN